MNFFISFSFGGLFLLCELSEHGYSHWKFFQAVFIKGILMSGISDLCMRYVLLLFWVAFYFAPGLTYLK